MSYADAVHQPEQIAKFAQDPIVSGVSAIKQGYTPGGDALTRQDQGLPGLSLKDRIQSAIPNTIRAIDAFSKKVVSGGMENVINFDTDNYTRLKIPQRKTQKAIKKLQKLANELPLILN